MHLRRRGFAIAGAGGTAAARPATTPLHGIGHNGGPKWGEGRMGLYMAWKKAHVKAWTDVPQPVVRMRMRRARRLGLTYREYTLEIMERGRHLSEADAVRIAEIIARRGGV